MTWQPVSPTLAANWFLRRCFAAGYVGGTRLAANFAMTSGSWDLEIGSHTVSVRTGSMPATEPPRSRVARSTSVILPASRLTTASCSESCGADTASRSTLEQYHHRQQQCELVADHGGVSRGPRNSAEIHCGGGGSSGRLQRKRFVDAADYVLWRKAERCKTIRRPAISPQIIPSCDPDSLQLLVRCRCGTWRRRQFLSRHPRRCSCLPLPGLLTARRTSCRDDQCNDDSC